jgi:hypothetical protein
MSDMTFQIHRLLEECSFGIKQVNAIVPSNAEDLVVIGLVCVFLKVFLSALYFRVTYCTHLQSLCSIHTNALCSRVPLGGTWEHKAHAWAGYKPWRWVANLPCGVHYSEFLDFFPVWGEHSVNHGRLCSVEDVRQVHGHRTLLYKSTMDLAQEWTPPRLCIQGLSISTELQYFIFLFASYTLIRTHNINMHHIHHLYNPYLHASLNWCSRLHIL